MKYFVRFVRAALLAVAITVGLLAIIRKNEGHAVLAGAYVFVALWLYDEREWR